MTIRIQSENFDIAEEIKSLRGENKNIGAIVTFTGTVRELAGDSKISSMTLEHYPGMTEKELERIWREAENRWPLIGGTIIHRYGELKPGDNIVLVITLSSHRQAAFEAAAFLMDFLKTRATFWKKETPLQGEADWVDARETDRDALKKWLSPN